MSQFNLFDRGNHPESTTISIGDVVVEVHPHPEDALSDGGQSLLPANFNAMMAALRPVAEAVDRGLAILEPAL